MQIMVTERRELPLPEELCKSLGIAPQTILEVREEDGRLVAEKVVENDPLAPIIGIWKNDGRSTDEIMAELRGER